MTSPINPVTPSSPPVPSPVPGSGINAAADQIAALAAQLNKPPLPFDPGSIRKGIVTAVDVGGSSTAPTISVLLSGDTTTPADGVRIAATYSPQVGETVLIYKQGSDFFAIMTIAAAGSVSASSAVGGWATASLNGAHGHGGNSNGDLMYRRVMDNGCWKVQWKGGITYGASTSVLSGALDADFRPSSKQSLAVARETATGGGATVGVDFKTDGTITIVSPTWSTESTGSHTHTYTGGTTGSGGTHAHTASNPTWITFANVAYFL